MSMLQLLYFNDFVALALLQRFPCNGFVGMGLLQKLHNIDCNVAMPSLHGLVAMASLQ